MLKRTVKYLSSEKANEIIYFNEQFIMGSTALLYFLYFGLIDVKEYTNEEDESVRSFTPGEIVIRLKEGIYTFKVSLARNTWAKIKMPAEHTLNDLHDYIQEAFTFNNDHMYSFFMDGTSID